MSLDKLVINQFRNLEPVELYPSSSLNIIYGNNASGKTSLLEAIHYLSTARSFRTPNIADIIQHDADYLLVSGLANKTQIGVKRSKKESLMKCNGQVVQRVSELAKYLPLQVIHPESHHLVSGGPKVRRQFIDWGVFHVEHDFYEVWLRYQKALKQKNSALKQRMHSVYHAWDEELSRMALKLNVMREDYIREFLALLPQFTQAIVGKHEIEMVYQAGWDTEQNLFQVLKHSIQKDIQRGFTYFGPHRAELVIKVNGYKAQAEISRGQQKMLVFAMRLAQAKLFAQKSGRVPVVLIDDITAELDAHHQATLMGVLGDMNAQVFITCIDPKQLACEHWQDKKKFHVEHGCVQQVVQ